MFRKAHIERPCSFVPSKQERQEAFVQRAREECLSPQQVIEHASFFPKVPKEKIKVLAWPKL